MTVDSDNFRIRTLITTIKGSSEQLAYDLTALESSDDFDREIVEWASGLTQHEPIVMRSDVRGTREASLPATGALVAEGSETASILWDASQAIAPVNSAEDFLPVLDLLRQVLLRLPSFMGLLLLGREVALPDYHTPASLAKLRIGVRRSTHNDPFALESEARESIRRARAARQEALDHYRNFAHDLRQRMRDGKRRAD